MSDKNVAVPKSVLTKVVDAFTGAFRSAFDQSNLVHTVCESLKGEYPSAVPGAAQKEMIDAIVAANPTWKGRTIDSRKSECRAIMRTHHVLETFTDAVRADRRCEKFNWHDGVRVARIVARQNKKGTATTAKVVAEYFKKNPKSKTDPLEKIATEILNSTSKSAFIKALQKVCSDFEYTLED